MTQVFFWLIFLMAIGIAIFTVQNSDAPLVTMKFLVWEFGTSLIYTLLGSFVVGVLFALFFWTPRVIKNSLRLRELKKENRRLEEMLFKPAPTGPGQEKLPER
jgi:uncharacterized integral membrane protein